MVTCQDDSRVDTYVANLVKQSAGGTYRITLNGSYLLNSKGQPLPGAHIYDCAGLFGSTCQTIISGSIYTGPSCWIPRSCPTGS